MPSAGPKCEDTRTRATLRLQLLSGKSVKDSDLSSDWLAEKWPVLLAAHLALPTPGRAVATADARYMIEHGVARISVDKGSKAHEPRKMARREVAAVKAWLASQDDVGEGPVEKGDPVPYTHLTLPTISPV